MLGADTSISFVPQYSIDPSVVGDCDQRFTQHFRSEMNAGMEITADDVAPNSFMVVDPHHPVDLRNAELIQAAAPSVGTIITPHTHHRPVLTIASSSVAMRMLNAALAGDALAISRELAAARRRSPHRTYHLFRAAAFRHPAWAVRIFEGKHLSFVEDEARHARPLYQKLLRRLASTALQAGNLDEAIRLSEAAVRIPTGEAERAAAETQLAELLVQRGKRDRTAADFKLAAAYASAAVKALPDDRRAWRVAANSLGLSHSWKQAAAAMRQALRLLPDDPAGHHNLAAYLLHAKDMPGAVKAARAAVALDPQNKAFQDRLDAALAGLQREGARAAPANGAAGRTPTAAT